ncbi:FAD synthetase family protein [Pseudogracilibacillus sp. SO30301A]|uniref:FAD synthetase family protein n=1 Tax=Pseudogracilibacillus sp. SO30301A TaxID=3098291 RepID=UPI00300DC880
MEVIYLTHLSTLKNLESHVMAIGFFDGVHLGHQELFKQAKEQARKLGIKSSALTFNPHPDEVIKGDTNRKYLTPLQEKITKISQCGIDKLYIMKFDKKFSSLPPMDFINKYIIGMNVKHVVVGFDFTFGFRAQGNTKVLERESFKGDFGLTVVPQKTYIDTKISSTETRKLLREGNVEIIPYYLGMNYQVKALINEPSQLDNTFSVNISDRYFLPKPGTYEVNIIFKNEVYVGEFNVLTNFKNELIIYDLETSDLKEELTIEFLNRLRVMRAVLV